MALITCKECNTEFSDFSDKCPKCNAPTEYSKETHKREPSKVTRMENTSSVNVTNPYYQDPPQETRSVSTLLLLGIIFFPFIFYWFLFRKGHTTFSRVAGGIWLISLIVLSASVGSIDSLDTNTHSKQMNNSNPTTSAAEQAQTSDSAPEQVQTPNSTPEQVQTPEPKPSEDRGIKVTAKQYFNDYHENEVSADNKYKGKVILISGNVSDINKDFSNNAYLSLQTGDILLFVRAELKSNQLEAAAQLNKGESVKLQCIGGTMLIQIPTLKKCSFISD